MRHNQLDRTAVSNLGQWCNYRFVLFLDCFLITLISIYGPTDRALFSAYCLFLHYLIRLRAFSPVSSHYLYTLGSQQPGSERGLVTAPLHEKHFCSPSLHSCTLFIPVTKKLTPDTEKHHITTTSVPKCNDQMNLMWINSCGFNDIFMQHLIFLCTLTVMV